MSNNTRHTDRRTVQHTTTPTSNPASAHPPLPPGAVPDGTARFAWEAIGAVRRTRNGRKAWHIPERNGEGEVIGWAIREDDGNKRFNPGGKRGLTLSWPLIPYAGSSIREPVFIVEGASDTAAGLGLCMQIVGRPSATGGQAHLRTLLADRHVCIIAERDEAGRLGADAIAKALLDVCASVKILEPPEGSKDLRQWVVNGATLGEILDRAAVLRPIDKAETPGSPETPTNISDSSTDTDDTPPLEGLPVLVPLSEVEPEEVRWLWPGRIALGKLTLLAGDPGLGKSFLTLDIAARLSRGAPWPDAASHEAPHTNSHESPNDPHNNPHDPHDTHKPPQSPGGVVLLSAEDGVADTIVPRLIAAGADRARIAAVSAVHESTDTGQAAQRGFELTRDLRALEHAVRNVPDCRLVIVDPISAYMGKADSHNNTEVRKVLAPLAELAERLDVAVLAVTHLRKGEGRAMYRAMGSLAFIAAVRAGWCVTADEHQPERRLVLPIKNNLAIDQGGLAYTITENDLGAHVHWEQSEVRLSADEALGQGGGQMRSEVDEAGQWLRDALTSGPKKATQLIARAKRDGIAERTLRRAKVTLGIRSHRESTQSGQAWMWHLPTPETCEQKQEKQAQTETSERAEPASKQSDAAKPADTAQKAPATNP